MKIVIYEIEKDYYGYDKNEEAYRGEFSSSKEAIKFLYDETSVKTTAPNISRAIKTGYVVLDKYLIFKI